MTKLLPLEATDCIGAVAFKVSEEARIAASETEPVPWRSG